MPRHRHAEGYVALVLAGGYTEAGDHGRLLVRPGQVVIHSPHEAHQDHFMPSGATVLNLPLNAGAMMDFGQVTGQAPDPDAIARLSERDLIGALALLRETMRPSDARIADWPDQLAAALGSTAEFSLEEWAARHGLAPQSISRGFKLAYGVSPKRYRLEQRALRAIGRLADWKQGLASLAIESGFSDQAHLTRAVVELTGRSPRQFRVKSVQAQDRSGR